MASQSDNFEDMAQIFFLLGDTIKLRIVNLLAKSELDAATICKTLGFPETRARNALNRLHRGGVLVSRKDQSQVYYSLADLSKHRLGRKPKTALPGTNAARFGSAELVIPKK